MSDTQIGFSLFAPYVETVELVGSWTEHSLVLKREDSGHWRLETALPDGRHTYRFRLRSLSPFMNGAVVEVTDPLARMVDETQGDAGVIEVKDGLEVTTAFDW